ncbi:protein of unknown function [Geodermatophilus dictyosporus]|uniref:DUF4397 domain-containing protein n=1 Tax=Geodermatophilus dictyosporus TaxID=1523247 RepID=A0A1I5KXI8_9ACTN|nr:DUF4397 domain-containing protein [Geodermatophilus dictyosporus]SFO89346.1 protein of unknown function [Geodermatophilus dictyosporus]
MTATRGAGAGRLLAVTALTAAVVGFPASAAHAAEGGLLRLAHLSPDTPAVDVYVDSVADPAVGQVFPGVDYGTVSEYQDVPPGSYAISMRPAGADPGTPPVLSTTVQVDADSARTVAGVGPFADLGLEVLEDDLTPPAPGSARLRVVAAAAGAQTLDVAVPGGPALAGGLAFADTTPYVDVPAGATAITVTPAGGQATELPVQVAAGSVYSVLVLDRPGGGLTVQTALDAAGPGVVPAGGVEAGAGGTADDGAPLPVTAGVVAGSLAAGAGLVLVATRAVAGRGPGRHAARSRVR